MSTGSKEVCCQGHQCITIAVHQEGILTLGFLQMATPYASHFCASYEMLRASLYVSVVCLIQLGVLVEDLKQVRQEARQTIRT